MSLPAHVHAEVQRILDGAARRLLAEQLDRDTLRATPPGHNRGALHGRTDQGALLVQGQAIPVRSGIDCYGGTVAA
jgi:hypothetical protein